MGEVQISTDVRRHFMKQITEYLTKDTPYLEIVPSVCYIYGYKQTVHLKQNYAII